MSRNAVLYANDMIETYGEDESYTIIYALWVNACQNNHNDASEAEFFADVINALYQSVRLEILWGPPLTTR